MSTKQYETLKAKIIALATTEAGISINEVNRTGRLKDVAYAIVRELGYLPARNGRFVRYFASPEHAAKYAAPVQQSFTAPAVRKGHANWTAETPAIITSATKITIAPPMPDPIRSNTFASY